MPVGDAPNKMHIYTTTYKEAVFQVWWPTRGTITLKQVAENLPPDEQGFTPHPTIIRGWITNENWVQRAEMMEKQVSRQLEKAAVEGRVEMLNRHADVGKELQEKALEYLQDHEITKMSDAIRLIELGVEIERTSRGVGDAIMRMAKASTEELNTIVSSVLQGVDPEEAKMLLAMEIKIDEEPETLDGEFRDGDGSSSGSDSDPAVWGDDSD